jgi:hypothetical protein
MDANTYDNYKSLLRSLFFYTKRDPIQQYQSTQFNKWEQNNAGKMQEIKKKYPNFQEAHKANISEEYF